MQNYSDDDHVVVSFYFIFISNQMDLTKEEFEFIEEYCLPESKGKLTPTIKRKSACGFTWRHLSKNFKAGFFTIEHSE